MHKKEQLLEQEQKTMNIKVNITEERVMLSNLKIRETTKFCVSRHIFIERFQSVKRKYF